MRERKQPLLESQAAAGIESRPEGQPRGKRTDQRCYLALELIGKQRDGSAQAGT